MNCCGGICENCENFHLTCEGCKQEDGYVFWAKRIGFERCPIYACCIKKRKETCASCHELPCGLFYADRGVSEDSIIKEVKERVLRLLY